MSKIGDFWKAHTDAEGRIAWPQEAAARDALARKLFGLCFVEALDSWLARADEMMEGTAFAGMPEEQREAIRRLVRGTVQGVLFSSLVHIDQNPRDHFDIRLVDAGSEGLAHPRRNEDIHDALYDWVWDFSVYRDQLMTREKTDSFESVRWNISGSRRDA